VGAFEAELDELQAASGAMRAATDPRVQAAAVTVPDVSVSGDADVTAALSAFSTAWRTGAQALTTDVESMADSLATTALSYAEVDMAVAAVLRALGVGPR
jgi:hypothetical protein